MSAILRRCAKSLRGLRLTGARQAFWVVFAVALAAHCALVFVVGPMIGIAEAFGGTRHDGYIELARSLAAGDGYVFEAGGHPVFHRPPLFVFLILPVALLPLSGQWLAILVVNSALLGLVALLLWELTRRTLSPRAATWAPWLLLLNPWVYLIGKNPMSAVLQALLYLVVVFMVWSIVDLQEAEGRLAVRLSVLGIAGGGLILSHGTGLPAFFALLALAGVLCGLRRRWKTVLGLVISAGVALAIMAPWSYRNWRTVGLFIPVTGSAGFTYFQGNAQWGIDGEPVSSEESIKDAALRHAGVDHRASEVQHFFGIWDPEVESILNERMVGHALGSPGSLLRKMLLNGLEFCFPFIHYLWVPSAYAGVPLEKLGISLFSLWAWGLAAVGLWMAWGDSSQRRGALFLAAVIVLYVLPYLPFVVGVMGHSQYAHGVFPFLAALGSIAVARALDTAPVLEVGSRRRGRARSAGEDAPPVL